MNYYRTMGDPHSNVVSSLGFVTSDSSSLGIVLPEYAGGTVTRYLEKNPDADREQLVSMLSTL